MGYKPKTRIGAKVGSHVRELLSVRERPNGELQVLLRTELAYETPHRGVGIISEKISIHPSHNADGTTLKRAAPLADGSLRTTVAFVKGPKTALAWPLFIQRVPQFNAKQYGLIAHEKDTVFLPIEYDDSKSSLFIMVFVSAIERPAVSFSEEWVGVSHISFTRYRLSVFHHFVRLPSLQNSDFIWVSTSLPQDSPNPVKPEKALVDRGGYSDQETEEMLDIAASRLGERLFHRLVPEGPSMASLGAKFACTTFTKFPMEQIEQAQNQRSIVFDTALPSRKYSKGRIISFKGQVYGKRLDDFLLF